MLDQRRPRPGLTNIALTLVVLAGFAMAASSPVLADTDKTVDKSASRNSTKHSQPLSGPEFDTPLTPGETASPENSQTAQPTPDYAFGAYQRGYYLTALQLALPRAETGDPAAQTLIAELYWNGLGVARDRKKAVDWYKFAADAGNRESQFAYANILLRGKLVEADKIAGENFMRKAAQAGHAKAQFNLAQIITAKRPTWAGFKNAFPWYEAAAKAGLPDAQYALANIYSEAKGINFNDDKKARVWMARAAENGFDTAQVEYAIWLINGRGGPVDKTRALYWFQRAAAQGNTIAQNRLSRMYAFGIGTKVDLVRAAAWHVVTRRAGFSDSEMDRTFAALENIDKKRALELANRLVGARGS